MAHSPSAPARPAVVAVVPAALDVALVVLFAAVGRASHERGHVLLGAVATAWPFLVGLALGWAVVALWRRRAAVTPADGVLVWLVTVTAGMLLRQASGQGTAVAFVVVATLTLAGLLIGWRLVWRLLAATRR